MNKGLVIAISVGVVALIVAGVAVFMFTRPKAPPTVKPEVIAEKTEGATRISKPPPPPLKIVVAVRNIPANVVVTMDMLTYKAVPHPQPAGTETDKKKIAGNITKMAIPKSAPVKTGNLFSGEKLSYLVPKYKRAVLFNVNQQSSLFYMVGPGDHVDVIGNFPSTTFTGNHPFVKTLLQNVTILASDRNMKPKSGLPPPPPPPDQAGGQPPPQQQAPPSIFSTVTVALTPRECEFLILAEKNADLRLVLRSPGNEEVEMTTGADRATLLSNEFIERWAGITSTLGHPHEVEVIKEDVTKKMEVTRE